MSRIRNSLGLIAMAILDIDNLSVIYRTQQGVIHAVSTVSFHIDEGEFVGIIGESGCGKTTVAKSVAMLLPSNASITNGSILYRGENLISMNEEQMRKLRWKEIAIIPQDAMNSLDPVYTVGSQMVEVITTHSELTKSQAHQRAAEIFEKVGIDSKRLEDYPHQLSGGMRQRALIAMSLLLDQGLVIADEPTTGLDVVVQDQILLQLVSILKEFKISMLMITHDIATVIENCDQIVVMYSGMVMEKGGVRAVLYSPFHPYTMGLINAIPRIGAGASAVISIPGYPPDLFSPLEHCAFTDRCPFVTSKCREVIPPLIEVEKGHFSRCHYPEKAVAFRELAKNQATWMEISVL